MWVFATAVFLVLVFFLYRHTKTTLKVFGILAALLALVGGALIYFSTRDGRSTYVDRDSMVIVSVNYDTTGCKKEYPLRVSISNGADKTLEKVSWYVAAFVPGRSTDITTYVRYSSDHILEPSKMVILCYKMPELTEPQEPSGLRWQAQGPIPSFRY